MIIYFSPVYSVNEPHLVGILEEELTRHLALAETSSVVAHDLCARLHVMKFCLEELSDGHKVSKHLTDEYLTQLNASTEYMDNLLVSYRGLLKLEQEEKETFEMSSLLNYSQYLTKSHYQGVSSYIFFDETFSDDSKSYSGRFLDYSHVIFAIYSCFIEWEQNRRECKEYNFVHELRDLENGQRSLSISLIGAKMSTQDFLSLIESRTKLKGRLRQWSGLDYLSEQANTQENFFRVEENPHQTMITIKLPA